MIDPPRRDETTRRTVSPAGAATGRSTPPLGGSGRVRRRGFRAAVVALLLVWAVAASAVALWLWRELRALSVGAIEVAEEIEPEAPPDRRVLVPVSFAELPGWNADRHAEALPALRRTCVRFAFLGPQRPVAPAELGGTVADWTPFCERVIALDRELEAARAGGGEDGDPSVDQRVRSLLETELVPFQVRNRDREIGLFTGYYEPLLRGSRRRGGPFQVPLYRRPSDLVAVDLGAFRESLRGQRIAGRIDGDRLVPYADRAAIETGALAGRRLELLWVDDPVDAFFLQIQGSGQVELEDGTRVRVGYDGQNGHPYFAIGRDLVERGALTIEEVSMQSIAAWLRTHPTEAPVVTRRNASYVFFRELSGEGPIGSQSVALTPERSLAVDTAFLPLGAPVWLDTTHPVHPAAESRPASASPAGESESESSDGAEEMVSTPAAPGVPYQRLLVAQDTGGAIRGPVRGDVFWGAGERAESIAGRMRSEGRLWILVPRALAERYTPDLFEVETPEISGR